jgi:hypothetical protein
MKFSCWKIFADRSEIDKPNDDDDDEYDEDGYDDDDDDGDEEGEEEEEIGDIKLFEEIRQPRMISDL